MRQRQQIYSSFLIFLLLSFVILIISPSAPVRYISGVIEKIFSPLQRSIYSNLGLSLSGEDDKIRSLKEENLRLLDQVISKKTLEADVQALRTQFAESPLPVRQLLPAHIIATNSVLPTTNPTQITINAGEKQGVKKGMGVIYKNVLLGSVSNTARERAIVTLLTSEKTALSAKTIKTGAIGILRGDKNNLLFGEVLLSEKLEQGDIVVTRGDISDAGIGFPPNLLIGKINAVQKKSSDLFQSARISTLIDLTKLSIVFVIIN